MRDSYVAMLSEIVALTMFFASVIVIGAITFDLLR